MIRDLLDANIYGKHVIDRATINAIAGGYLFLLANRAITEA